jgi:tetratricopeptide (TPR) repeat protein
MSLMDDGEWEDAEPHLRAAALGFAEQLGENHGEALDALGALTALEVWQGRYADAADHCDCGLKAAERIIDPAEADFVKGHFLFRRGMLCAAEKKYPEAEEAFTRSWRINERIFGADHYYTINCRLHQALAWHEAGRWDEAGASLKGCLEAYGRKLPANHPTVLFTWSWYADNLLARQQFAAAAQAMRRILIDNARRKARSKHGGGKVRLDLDLREVETNAADELLALDEALTKFGQTDATAARLVQLRYFGGLSMPQAAEVLKISLRTAERLWTYARAWLSDALND